MIFCQYKDIFGKPNQGVHKYRLFNIAIVDTVMTIFAAILFAKIFKRSFILIFIILMLLSVILHALFCVKTTITKFLMLV